MVAMIHKTKGFVYHHVPKTGGSSISNWIAKNIGQDMYWIGTKGVRTLTRDAPTKNMFLCDTDWMNWWRKRPSFFPPHISVSRVKRLVRSNPRTKHLRTWQFLFMRNPYDWLTSLFWYRKDQELYSYYRKHGGNKWINPKDDREAFDCFIDCMLLPKGDPLQSHWIDSKVDLIGDFCKLEEEFTRVMSLFEIKVDKFPVINQSTPKKAVYFWDDKRLLDKATRLLRRDIRLYEKTFNKKAEYDTRS